MILFSKYNIIAKQYPFGSYLLNFIILFSLCYATNLLVIGLSAKGGYYNEFVSFHLNYISWLRHCLLLTSNLICRALGYSTYLEGDYLLKMKSGAAVKMVYQCIGYGILSFWCAFVLANKGKIIYKIKWLLVGCFLIFIINTLRISLLLISIETNHKLTFIDHHTFFNIIAYGLIIMMMIFYDYKLKNNIKNIDT